MHSAQGLFWKRVNNIVELLLLVINVPEPEASLNDNKPGLCAVRPEGGKVKAGSQWLSFVTHVRVTNVMW